MKKYLILVVVIASFAFISGCTIQNSQYKLLYEAQPHKEKIK